MTMGLELAALTVLPFAAALALGAAFAALDVATNRSAGFLLTLCAAAALIAAMFMLLTQTFHVDFKTEIFALGPLSGLIGLFVGYGLGKTAKPRSRDVRAR